MPVYSVKCELCGAEDEIIVGISERKTTCRKCNAGWTTRIPSVHGPNCSNDSASWLPSVLEVVEKDSTKPHVQAFLQDPTRANYKAWMKGEGIRPLEPGEKNKKAELDLNRHAEKVMEMKQKRERMEVRG